MSKREGLLFAEGIEKTYLLGRYPLHVLKSCTLSVADGEFVAITGASGSGKSTLLHIMGALDVPDRGRVRLQSEDIFARSPASRDRMRNRTFGFVFQFYHLLPELNVLENVLLPLMVGSSIAAWFGRRREARAAAEEIVERVGLKERVRHRPNELSGGERQRVAIARALVTRPRILLADEPTGNLDTSTGREILSLFTRLNREGQTIVMVTHDAHLASATHRVVTLVDGRIRATPAPGASA